MCAIMHEPHKFPRFTIYNLQKDYLPSLHNLTTKYHKHQETTTTHTNHTHNISHYPLHPSHPNFQNKKKILQDSAFDQARVVKVRYTRSAHDSHPPTNRGNRPPNDRPTAFVVDDDFVETFGLCWKVGSFYLGQCVKSRKPVIFLLFMIHFVYRHHIHLLRCRG